MNIADDEYIFLVKSLLGQKININKITKNDNLLLVEACIARADRDMITGGCNYLISGMKENRRKKLEDCIKKNNYCFSQKIIKGIQDEIKKEIKEGINNRDRENISWGLAQKIVNMTFKYFYLFRNNIGNIHKKSFVECDCPIDSIILERIGYKTNVWSKISKDEYIDIQDTIKQIITNDNTGKYDKFDYDCGNLRFDFLNW